jgi:MFS family permease
MTDAQLPYPSARVAWYATGILSILIWLSVLDRFIISLMVGPMKHDLGITDVQFGILNGFVFTVTYAVLGLAIGVMADRHDRRGLIFFGVAVWSLATAACGMAQRFWQLMLARVGVGAGEAALGPCAASMLADLFPRDRLTFATSVYNLGSVVGAGMAYVIGGQIVEFVSRTPEYSLPLIGAVRSWQAVFFIVGIPGALLSLIIFTVPEPVRRGLRNAEALRRTGLQGYRALWAFIRERGRFFVCHYLGFGLAGVVLVGTGSWYAPHLARSFHWSPAEVGLGVGFFLSIGSILGMMISGRVVDYLFRKGYRDAQMRYYMFSLLIATPIGIVAMTSGNAWVYLSLVALLAIFMSPMPAMAITSLNIVTPNELRGAGAAFYALASGILAAGGGPVVIAAVSDYIYKDENAIGLAMATVIAIALPLAALCMWLGLRPLRAAVQQAELWADKTA